MHLLIVAGELDDAAFGRQAAAQNGDVEMAKVLVAGGADVNVRAENNQMPLDLALTKGQQAMVDYLESNGAKL